MFARRMRPGPELAAPEAAEATVRARHRLLERDLALVFEEPPSLPGQPETVATVLLWKGGERYRIRIFKPVAAVTGDGLPVGRIAGALRDEGDTECC